MGYGKRVMAAENDNDSLLQAEFARYLEAGMARKTALYTLLKQRIISGQLNYLTKLPPSRALAQQLRLSRDTVEISYAQLEAEGYITRGVGRGSFISYQQHTLIGHELLAANGPADALLMEQELSNHGRRLLTISHEQHARHNASLTPSLPDLRAFPMENWLQAQRLAIRQYGERMLGSTDVQGLPELREEIVRYWQRERGIEASAEQVIVVTSSQQALSLCTQVLFNPGDTVFVEEPGYQGAKKLAQSAGLIAQPITIDQFGLDLTHLTEMSAGGRGAYVTPSHHYPLGHSLSLERRLQLLHWAQRERAWIIEDDYDSEFNYDQRLKASLQGLDRHQRTLYIGTFSKTLLPGLRIGFMVVPPQLVKPMVAAKQFQDGYTSMLTQMTLFKFLHEGLYTEHLRNMRTLYQARLAILHAVVHQYLSDWTRPVLPQGGLQLVCPLADAATERLLIQTAAKQQVKLYGLADFYTGLPQCGALVLGFAAYTPDEIVHFIRKLAQIFSHVVIKKSR